ncbi:uncharacterized protein LOC118900629 [Balaenoptera musculus]|uniref:Uncharacterized protein LOC118900629 n=1 Tax=Balaenoptera musculus TaxID=9771 RepID=A0A8B8YHK1_BALMU|nr:uncharacterized protein LOC118900629 [Balaenoptera musculus]XP_036719011.1 uncharacterized protein LOC118900629 [Balaenoptera musculus]
MFILKKKSEGQRNGNPQMPETRREIKARAEKEADVLVAHLVFLASLFTVPNYTTNAASLFTLWMPVFFLPQMISPFKYLITRSSCAQAHCFCYPILFSGSTIVSCLSANSHQPTNKITPPILKNPSLGPTLLFTSHPIFLLLWRAKSSRESSGLSAFSLEPISMRVCLHPSTEAAHQGPPRLQFSIFNLFDPSATFTEFTPFFWKQVFHLASKYLLSLLSCLTDYFSFADSSSSPYKHGNAPTLSLRHSKQSLNFPPHFPVPAACKALPLLTSPHLHPSQRPRPPSFRSLFKYHHLTFLS